MHTFIIHTHPHTYMYTLISNKYSFTQHTLTHPTNTNNSCARAHTHTPNIHYTLTKKIHTYTHINHRMKARESSRTVHKGERRECSSMAWARRWQSAKMEEVHISLEMGGRLPRSRWRTRRGRSGSNGGKGRRPRGGDGHEADAIGGAGSEVHRR